MIPHSHPPCLRASIIIFVPRNNILMLNVFESFASTDCPAEVYVEIKGCGDAFVPYSPTMQTSGLQSVYIQFARGLPAKVSRLLLYLTTQVFEVCFKVCFEAREKLFYL